MSDVAFSVFDLISLFFDFGITIICFVVCYKLAKKNNMSGWFTFLGFFGVFGIVAVLLISKYSNTNYDNYNKMNNQNNYNGEGNYNSPNSSDTYIHNGEVITKKFKNCPKCGAKLEEKASYCIYCGKEF